MPLQVMIINPLAGTLKHYATELRDVIGATDIEAKAEIVAFDEPSISGRGKLSWCWEYFRTLLAFRKSRGALVLIVWPVFGFLDILLARLVIGANALVIIHDTKPLVRAVGYDRFSRVLGGIVSRRGSIIVHSQAAYDDLGSERLQRKSVVLAHPILECSRNSPTVTATSGAPVVRVLGQYKPDRDLHAMQGIGAGAPARGALLEVAGRGWPSIEGWNVVDQFVTESQLDDLIESSDVVLIPYRRFYQSGIAIRCLEHGISVVGPAGTSLDDLLGVGSHLLVRASRDPAAEWWRAIDYATASRGEEAEAAARNWRQRALRSWSDFLASHPPGAEQVHDTGSPS